MAKTEGYATDQAYNLNLAGSDILAPDGGGNRHISPKCSNRAFWDRNRETNMARDKRVPRQLRGRGWKVIRIWQLPSAVYAVLRYQLIAKVVVCDAGPLIHLDELDCLDLLGDYPEVLVPEAAWRQGEQRSFGVGEQVFV